ncbi:MAG: hypothetical protein ACRDO2_10295, partial [Nocardioidaceae bacterium]
GYRRPSPMLPLGLLVIAVGSAAAWVLPDAQWPMLAAGGFVAGGAGAALLAAVRMMAGHEAAWRFVTGTALVALLVGLAAQVPMAWVLGGSVADSVRDARAAGRIALGVLFVAAVMAATVTAILLDRARPPRPHALSDARPAADADRAADADAADADAAAGAGRAADAAVDAEAATGGGLERSRPA